LRIGGLAAEERSLADNMPRHAMLGFGAGKASPPEGEGNAAFSGGSPPAPWRTVGPAKGQTVELSPYRHDTKVAQWRRATALGRWPFIKKQALWLPSVLTLQKLGEVLVDEPLLQSFLYPKG